MNKDVPYKEFAPYYWVTDKGEVISKRTNKKIRISPNLRGYMKVRLHADGVSKTVGVHRMVALAFVPTEDTSLQVDHIDNVKSNNHASNLQWLTPSQNVAKAFKQGRTGSRKGKLSGKNTLFYISNDNIEALRLWREATGGSMSGLVNKLLAEKFGSAPSEKVIQEPVVVPMEEWQ